MALDGVTVEGLAELDLALRKAAPEVERELRVELRELAEPIRGDVERLAAERIRNLGPKWGRMRIGSTRREVYVVPRQRGVRGRGPNPRRRPNFALLMERRAMEPALEEHVHEVGVRVDRLLTRYAEIWSR